MKPSPESVFLQMVRFVRLDTVSLIQILIQLKTIRSVFYRPFSEHKQQIYSTPSRINTTRKHTPSFPISTFQKMVISRPSL